MLRSRNSSWCHFVNCSTLDVSGSPCFSYFWSSFSRRTSRNFREMWPCQSMAYYWRNRVRLWSRAVCTFTLYQVIQWSCWVSPSGNCVSVSRQHGASKQDMMSSIWDMTSAFDGMSQLDLTNGNLLLDQYLDKIKNIYRGTASILSRYFLKINLTWLTNYCVYLRIVFCIFHDSVIDVCAHLTCSNLS